MDLGFEAGSVNGGEEGEALGTDSELRDLGVRRKRKRRGEGEGKWWSRYEVGTERRRGDWNSAHGGVIRAEFGVC